MLRTLALSSALVAVVHAQDFPAPVARASQWPVTVVIADMDGNGRPDLLSAEVTGVAGPHLGVTLALPGGGWADPAIYLFAAATNDVAAGALDDDGQADVAVAHGFTPNVSVLRGAGGGALGPEESWSVGGGQLAVRLADLDGDTHLDLVTLRSAGSVSVRLADGLGGFLDAVTFPASPFGDYSGELELGDLDLDGDMDVVVACKNVHTVAALLGDGLGGFGAPASHAVAGVVMDLCVADATGDGAPDALVAHTYGIVPSESLSLFEGDGAGALAPALSLEAGGGATAVEVADLDADGKPDVLATVLGLFPASWAPDGVIVRRGLGLGVFAPPVAWRSQPGSEAMAVADVDGDGALDVATTQPAAHSIGFLLGDGRGGLQSPSLYGVQRPSSIDVAHMDGDDQLDLVVAGGTTNVLNVLHADGAGGFLAPQSYAMPSNVSDAATGDFDGDGATDVLAAGGGAFELLRGDGQGGLLAPQHVPVPSPVPSAALAVEVTDLDGDGDLDGFATSVSLAVALLGDGAGGLVAGGTVSTGGYSVDIETGDLDGDGAPDAVTANAWFETITIVRGDGAGGLLPGGNLFADGDAQGVALEDFDLDGALDFVVVQAANAGLKQFLGNGLGGLKGSTIYTGSGTGRSVAAGDLDGDGAPDVAVAEELQRVAVWRGDGAGGLLSPQRWSAGFMSRGVVIHDLDGDARPELLVANAPSTTGTTGQGSISVLHNATAPFVWADLGFALGGSQGEPELVGQGALVFGTPGSLALHHARPLALAVLFISPSFQPLPFKGGTLVPLPPALLLSLATSASGSVSLDWLAWPINLPGMAWYFQYGIADAGAPHGVSLSNALRGEEP